MRLGISPAAAPTPTGVFNQRFEALFPSAGAPGYEVCFAPRRLSSLSMHKCGATGCYPPHCLPRSSHTLSVLVPPWQHESSPSRLPISAPPTGLDECLFFISLVSDFLVVQFSVSSGCARRRSVSTYTTILVLPVLSFGPFFCVLLHLLLKGAEP